MDEESYNLNIQGPAQGIVVGKGNTVTNNFSNRPVRSTEIQVLP